MYINAHRSFYVYFTKNVYTFYMDVNEQFGLVNTYSFYSVLLLLPKLMVVLTK